MPEFPYLKSQLALSAADQVEANLLAHLMIKECGIKSKETILTTNQNFSVQIVEGSTGVMLHLFCHCERTEDKCRQRGYRWL